MRVSKDGIGHNTKSKHLPVVVVSITINTWMIYKLQDYEFEQVLSLYDVPWLEPLRTSSINVASQMKASTVELHFNEISDSK